MASRAATPPPAIKTRNFSFDLMVDIVAARARVHTSAVALIQVAENPQPAERGRAAFRRPFVHGGGWPYEFCTRTAAAPPRRRCRKLSAVPRAAGPRR